MATVNCKHCGVEFKQKQNVEMFCSRKCFSDSRKGVERVYNCGYCGKEIIATKRRPRKYCNRDCYSKAMVKPLIKLVCEGCGDTFFAKPNSTRRYNKFCGRECSLINLSRVKYGKILKKGDLNLKKVFPYEIDLERGGQTNE